MKLLTSTYRRQCTEETFRTETKKTYKKKNLGGKNGRLYTYNLCVQKKSVVVYSGVPASFQKVCGKIFRYTISFIKPATKKPPDDSAFDDYFTNNWIYTDEDCLDFFETVIRCFCLNEDLWPVSKTTCSRKLTINTIKIHVVEKRDIGVQTDNTHTHCRTCYKKECGITKHIESSCELIYCCNGCGQRFHQCKSEDHDLICCHKMVSCINYQFGCPFKMARWKIVSHLEVCPASVVSCSIQWDRKQIHSYKNCIRMPLPITCTQLDVALALRDQRMLAQSMKMHKQIENYPAQARSSMPLDSDRATNDSTQQIANSPTQAHSSKSLDSYRTIDDTLRAAAAIASYHLSKAESKQFTRDMYWCKLLSQKLSEEISHNEEKVDDSVGDVFLGNEYKEEIKLNDVLSVSIESEMYWPYKFKPKPEMVETFFCAQDFRRDEYPWHLKNVHLDIQSGLSGVMEKRCPFAYRGCDFSYRQLSPLEPRGKIIHSSLQESFGLILDSECERIDDTEAQCKKYSTTEPDRRKSREATPEITSSSKFDSKIKILPKYLYKHDDANCLPTSHHDELQLQCLPFDVLQHIGLFLDGFSLCNLSLTCKLLREVCASILHYKGMVVPVWQVKKSGNKSSWSIAYWKWIFSTSFTPVRKWEYSIGTSLFKHLKICPYNQKNIPRYPYHMYTCKVIEQEVDYKKEHLKALARRLFSPIYTSGKMGKHHRNQSF